MIFSLWKKKDNKGIHEMQDHELIQKYKTEADPDIIAELFNRYTHLVYGICLKYLNNKDDAQDAVMEIFEDLPDIISGYEIRNFKSWLYSVSRNHCLMILRANKAISHQEEKYWKIPNEPFMEMSNDLHQEVEPQEFDANSLDAAIIELNEPQRKCLEMVYLRGKSYHEASEETGYSMNEVKSHVQNGKRNLKIRLGQKNA